MRRRLVGARFRDLAQGREGVVVDVRVDRGPELPFPRVVDMLFADGVVLTFPLHVVLFRWAEK